ncbi:MAG: transcription antitermination factor NusB [candidate division Zixibacteria bacterium]|nr:transcription antitermination factor NusB [candidate division Zixibacteria bacterium]
MSNRHRAREHVLKALYALELGEQSREEISTTLIENGGIDEAVLDFAKELFGKVAQYTPKLDVYISRLATNWDIERLAVVDKNILRMAICEVEHLPDVPIKVAINEAIELAKKYSTLESASFVNGVLDKVMKDKEELVKKEEAEKAGDIKETE